MVLGRLWRKSAPELMGAELLIMYCLLSDCEELVGIDQGTK